jgi:hypothetical protein
MAKRSRIGGRPGQRRPLERPSTRPGSAPIRPANALTSEEEARAAELEAAIVAQEKAAEDARRGRNRERAAAADAPLYSSQPLAARAAQEYDYVRRDVRRITVVGGGLLGILAILHLLVNVFDVL